MIYDGVLCTHNGTGGTGALTIASQSGSTAFGDAIPSGTYAVYYTITEYTDSTKATVLQRESGIGYYSNSANTLTRTTVQTTWASSVFLPKTSVTTQPTALTIGNTAANVDIACSPASGNHIMPMYAYNIGGSGADNIGIAPLSVPNSSSSLTYSLNSGTTYFFPVWIGHVGPFTIASFRVTTAATAGSAPTPAISIALYQPDPTSGLPHKRMINFGSATITATAPVTVSTTALVTPVLITPGWYYQAMLYLVGGGSGTPSLKAYTPITGLAGTSMANNGPITGINAGTQTTLSDPAATPAYTNTGYTTPLVVYQ